MVAQCEVWIAVWHCTGCSLHRISHQRRSRSAFDVSLGCEAEFSRFSPNLEFTGKVALIIGGTSGIGAVTARRVAELGAKVVITGRRLREGRLLVNEIKRNGGCAAFFQADLSQPDQVRLIVPFTVETFGRLNYAFNNAATSGREPAADRSDRRELRSCIRCQRKGVVSSASGGGEPDART